MKAARLIFLAGMMLIAAGATNAVSLPELARANNVPVYDVEIVEEIPHNAQSFTQGLFLNGGALYESTGLYGQSALNKLDPASGKLLQTVALDSAYFAEGLALCGGDIIQLTWRENTAFVWKLPGFELSKTFYYSGEGWGLTTDGRSLIMSDGSEWLFLRNMSDFSLEDSLAVTIAGRRINGLNELEYAGGHLYANFLGLDDIAEIDPASGRITGLIDAAALRDRISGTPYETPMNGIAYDSTSGDFFLTGKLWPKIFRVKFVASFGR